MPEKEHQFDPLLSDKTAEEIAPNLWKAYAQRLNDEALIALRQVIEDVDNHEKIHFKDTEFLDVAFSWRGAKQGYEFWRDVYDGEYDKPVNSDEDVGSAATSKHYNSKLIQPIEIAQMVLTPEEFQGAMKFNIMKYTQRAGSKEGESSQKDWNKALQYKLWLELAKQGKIINPREDVIKGE